MVLMTAFPVNDTCCCCRLPLGFIDVTAFVRSCACSGNGIIRVDITADGGKTWTSADLRQHDIGQKRGRCAADSLITRGSVHLQGLCQCTRCAL